MLANIAFPQSAHSLLLMACIPLPTARNSRSHLFMPPAPGRLTDAQNYILTAHSMDHVAFSM